MPTLIVPVFLLTSLLPVWWTGCTKENLGDDRGVKELFLFFGRQIGKPEPVRPLLKNDTAHCPPRSLNGHFMKTEDVVSYNTDSSHRVLSGLVVISSFNPAW